MYDDTKTDIVGEKCKWPQSVCKKAVGNNVSFVHQPPEMDPQAIQWCEQKFI